MVSVYNDDTNKDGLINTSDLRRLYFFDINGTNKKLLIPENYSVMSSEYDLENDVMYVFAKIDENKNGKSELKEKTHIFIVDLNNPDIVNRLY